MPEEKKTGLTKVEVAKIVFKLGHDLMEKHEDDDKLELTEIMEEVQEFVASAYREYLD